MTDVQIRLRIDDEDDLNTALEVAERHGVDARAVSDEQPGGVTKGQMIEPVTAILVGAAAVAIAKFVADWWDKRRGGLVIDQQPGAKDNIYRDAEVPYGFVLVYPPNGGVVKVETKDMPKDAFERLLETLITTAFKSVTDIASAAKQVLSSDKVTEKQPLA